jgi:hypothetical protein
MKRIILGGLSLLLLSTAAAPAAFAQATSEAPPENAETLGMAVTPFNLVFLAYQGFFENEGIPKFNRLITEHQAGRVTSEDLVEVAINMRRLPADTINNRGYLSAVERQLESLYGDMNH